MAELRMSGSSTIAPGEVEVCSVWKGENESDPELVENYDTDLLAWVCGMLWNLRALLTSCGVIPANCKLLFHWMEKPNVVGILVVIFITPVEVFGTRIWTESSDQYHSDKGDLQTAQINGSCHFVLWTNCKLGNHELEQLSDHSQFTLITNFDLWL